MKCHIMIHFIWVFAVCQRTHLGDTSIEGDKDFHSMNYLMLVDKINMELPILYFRGLLVEIFIKKMHFCP